MKSMIMMLCLAISLAVHAQPQPVKWDVVVSPPAADETRTITATATMDTDWAIYSQYTADEGPVPTSFSYQGVETVGDTEENSEVITKFSDLFEVEVKKFIEKAVFTQIVKPVPGQKSGSVVINFMCCDSQKCLPPTDVAFEFDL